MTKGIDLIQRFEQFASLKLAESWDHPGLQIGNPEQPIHKLMTTLDVRPEVVAEAIQQDVNFIFAHHPIMFHPAKNLDTRNPQNQMYADLLSHHITVYAAHTNLDSANGGMNDWLADQLHLTALHRLLDHGVDPVSGAPVGMGRVGELANPLTPAEFIQYCINVFAVPGVRWVQNPADQDRLIRRVAILGGAGQDFWPAAVDARADAYVTGDVTYHFAHDMVANHLTVVDPGHHIEAICEPRLAELFKQWQADCGWQFEIVQNNVNTDPFHFALA